MLEVREVSAGYGSDVVLHECSLTVGAGEVVALIGANGAGKSTLVKSISGLLTLRRGEITLDGTRVDGLTPRERLERGIVHVPEGRQVFAGLSVAENLALGAHAVHESRDRGFVERCIAQSCEYFPALLDRLGEPAGNLSGGQQQMLAIARGLMSRPRYLLLDEPSLGLAPLLVSETFRLIARLSQSGISILLSEQNARQSLAVSDRAYVLELGRITLEGRSKAILDSGDVSEKYLGGSGAANRNPSRQAALEASLRAIL
ncbi:ABC transporter ATP-binding protein [Bosea massiliensis]|uniref:ABC transporter ATP-binding protein n=1 Tax=Bosea massiliensis TaxID=151419 RepID=A0ABW0PC17_9HYPH